MLGKISGIVRSIDNVYGEVALVWVSPRGRLSNRQHAGGLHSVICKSQRYVGGLREGRAVPPHFLFQEGSPRKWFVHFDLHSPVHSFGSAGKHLRHEFLGKICPDWKMIKQCFKT